MHSTTHTIINQLQAEIAQLNAGPRCHYPENNFRRHLLERRLSDVLYNHQLHLHHEAALASV